MSNGLKSNQFDPKKGGRLKANANVTDFDPMKGQLVANAQKKKKQPVRLSDAEKMGLTKPHCNEVPEDIRESGYMVQPLKPADSYNLQLAFAIMEFYGTYGLDTDVDAIVTKCRELHSKCRMFVVDQLRHSKVKDLSKTAGLYDSSINSIIMTRRDAGMPYNMAALLIHEGYHAISNQHYVDEEVLAREKEGRFMNHVLNNVADYYKEHHRSFYSERSAGMLDKTKLFNDEAKARANNLQYNINRGQLLDHVISKEKGEDLNTYAKSITLNWLVKNWDAYGGFGSRKKGSIIVFFSAFAKANQLTEEQYQVLLEMLRKIKFIHEYGSEFFEEELAEKVVDLFPSRWQRELTTEEKEIKAWLEK